jgi:hypothetical protein
MRKPLNLHLLLPAVAGFSLSIAVAACASSDGPDLRAEQNNGRQCFLASQVRGFDPVDDDTVDVEIGRRDVFRLELTGICRDVQWATAVGIRARGGGSWVCRGMDAELIVPAITGVDRCLVTGVRKLSIEELAAKREARRSRRN